MADIFFSYASKDRDKVIPIVKELEELGWSIWWDQENIPVGQTWRGFIEKGLSDSRCVLVAWSQKSISSQWVLEEAEYGKDKNTLVPALIDNVRPPFGFGRIQAANLIQWDGKSAHSGFQQLLRALQDILGLPQKLALRERLPDSIKKQLGVLIKALDSAIPKKSDNNLLIASWNLNRFGFLNRKWISSDSDTPKRDLFGLRVICEIISRFDVIAIQEVTGDLSALHYTMGFLGSNWSFLMTDITLGPAGNDERMAFLFDNTRLQPFGLAGELIVPPEYLDQISEDAFRRQFIRTPYSVSLRRKETNFTLVTLQFDYDDNSSDRIPELNGIASWMADWAHSSSKSQSNLIALGDFNIDRSEDNVYRAITSTGLFIPEYLHSVPRSIIGTASIDKYYDQIAWFHSTKGERSHMLSMKYKNAGSFEFLPHVYIKKKLTKKSISYRVSDHYPMWVEFEV